MAQLSRIPVEFGAAFPHGAFVVNVSPRRDFAASTKEREVQARDRDTGELEWEAECLDGDPESRDRSFKVRITAPQQPVPPQAAAGTPFRPVEFEGLMVTAWVDNSRCTTPRPGEAHRCRAKQGVSYHATGLRAPSAGTRRIGSDEGRPPDVGLDVSARKWPDAGGVQQIPGPGADAVPGRPRRDVGDLRRKPRARGCRGCAVRPRSRRRRGGLWRRDRTRARLGRPRPARPAHPSVTQAVRAPRWPSRCPRTLPTHGMESKARTTLCLLDT